MNKCTICFVECPNYTAYHMHMELFHKPGVIQPHRGKFLTKAEKALIVSRGEDRIGRKHFIDVNTIVEEVLNLDWKG